MAGKCTLEAVKSGLVSIDDLMKLNALMDMEQAYEGFFAEQANKKAG